MKTSSWAVIGLAVIAPLTLALGGCGSSDKSDSDKANGSIPSDPKQAVAASAKKLADGNFRFTVSDGESNSSGAVNKPDQSAELTTETAGTNGRMKMTIGFRVIGQDSWIQVKSPDPEVAKLLQVPPDKWLHLDHNKVAKTAWAIDFADPDPGDAAKILKTVVSAKKTGEGNYSGTLDVSQLTGSDVITEDTVISLDDKAKAVPFTAQLDSQGRLASLKIEIPEAEVKGRIVELTYAEYGSAPSPKRPGDGEAQEAPAKLYDLIGKD